METIIVSYLGDLRASSRHLQSNSEIVTDAPTDNHGRGEFFSPTDLVATSLGTCMLTTVGVRCRNINLIGTQMKITKIMQSFPRQISEIVIEFFFPDHGYTEEEKKNIQQIANNCPVAKSLHPDILQTVIFNYK